MAALYPGTSVSGYNANPPPDDGTQVATNLVTWAGIKTKIGDPINTFASAVDSNITSAFGKTVDGATVVKTSTNYAMTSADQGRMIVATTSGITITTPDAGTVNAPFLFFINNQSTGSITLAGNATNSQTVDGQTSQPIEIGAGCGVKTDGTNWFTSGLKAPQITASGANYGFGLPVNLGLVASVGSNILTVAVKTVAGSDPSAGNPVLIPFRDATIANGDPVWVTVSSALNITTNATGATLGTQNGVPFRLWVLAFNNAGTVELALWHSGAGSATPVINPLNPSTLQSTTGISSGATSAGVFYTPNGVTLSTCAFTILGYLDYASGLTTAGTYASVPTKLQLFGAGIRLPGEKIQFATATATGATSVTSSTKTQTNTQISITPTATVNLIRVSAVGVMQVGTGGQLAAQLSRGTGPTLFGSIGSTNVAAINATASVKGVDAPATTSSLTYSVYIWLAIGSTSSSWLGTISGLVMQSEIEAEEIMA